MRFFLASLVFLVTIFTSSVSGDTTKSFVAVFDFDATQISKGEGQILTEKFRTELFNTGAFKVIERNKMEQILTEQGFQQTGCTSEECAIEAGELLGVTMIISGTIGKVGSTFSISARLIDVQTAEILRVADEMMQCKIDDLLISGMKSLALKIANQESEISSSVKKSPKTTKTAKNDKPDDDNSSEENVNTTANTMNAFANIVNAIAGAPRPPRPAPRASSRKVVKISPTSRTIGKPTASMIIRRADDNYNKKKYNDAEKSYLNYIRQYPNGAKCCYAHYKLAKIYKSRNNRGQLNRQINNLKRKCPKSTYTRKAKLLAK